MTKYLNYLLSILPKHPALRILVFIPLLALLTMTLVDTLAPVITARSISLRRQDTTFDFKEVPCLV